MDLATFLIMFSGLQEEDINECGITHSSINFSPRFFIFDIIFIIVACKVCHLFLRRLGQHRIVSEFIVGMIVANVPYIKMEKQILDVFTHIEFIASSTYMFVLGLEMEPLAILRPPGPEASIAIAGIVSTISLTFITYVLFHFQEMRSNLHLDQSHEPRIVTAFAVMFAACSSPIVTRLTTELKLGKSEIGRLAIRASLTNDMICTLIMCLLLALRGETGEGSSTHIFLVFLGVGVEMTIIKVVVRPIFLWVNEKNPEGKPVNRVHLVSTIALAMLLCYSSLIFKYDTKVNAFLVGLALPREGRVSNFFISKINYIHTTFVLPLYFSLSDLHVNPKVWKKSLAGAKTSWYNLSFITVVATIGKLSGTLAAGTYYGLHWLEAVTLGVLLNIKGYLHIFFTAHSVRKDLMEDNSLIVMGFAVMLTIIFAPLIVSYIVQHVRLQGGTLRLMGLQWYNPTSDLKIMAGLHGPHNVSSTINLLNLMHGAPTRPSTILVHMVDMIELTDHAAASLVYSQDVDEIMVADDNVVDLREEIGAALEAYMNQGLTFHRILAVSSYEDMHEDICCGAKDCLALLIILPFHKKQRVDGTMEESGHLQFQIVNQNVLKHATCSVGILVDRGLGRITTTIVETSVNVVVVFIGGADSREALAYAGCISRSPLVRLMVIRFVPDKEAMMERRGRIMAAITEEEKDSMEEDEEYFERFYEEYVVNTGVEYMERHVRNGAEAVAVLKVMKEGCQLFVVGKGREKDSVLTAGMGEWAECPELGAIGDILASSEFSVTASVLVIQQFDHTQDTDLLSYEFRPY